MLGSTDRIRTTHVGSLARPAALLDLMRAAAQGDGEQTKTGFYAYIGDRLGGFEPRADGDFPAVALIGPAETGPGTLVVLQTGCKVR